MTYRTQINHALAPLLALALAPAGCGDDVVTSVSASDSDSDSGGSGTNSTGTSGSGSDGTSVGPSGSESESETHDATSDTAGSTSSATSDALTSTSATSDATSTTGPETTSSSSTDSTSSSTDPSTGSSTAGTTSDTDTDTETDTGGLLGICDDDTLPYAGPLCGPPQNPCALTTNEAVSPDHAFRNEAPAIAFDSECSPQVLYSVAEGGFHGFFAARTGDDSWAIESTPMDIARVGLDFDPAGDLTYALAYGGAFDSSLWSRDGDGQWALEEAVAGKHIGSAYAFARDSQGQLHAGLFSNNYVAEHALWDGQWALQSFGGQAQQTTLALDLVDDTPNVTYWSSQNATWELFWATPSEGPEVVAALGSNVLEVLPHGVAVIPADNNDPLAATPYVQLAVKQANNLHRLMLAHRQDENSWALEEIIAEDDANASLCNAPPQFEGEVCDYDYVRYRPLGVVASAGGDVRFFYLMTNYMGSLQAMCVQFPFPMCWWNPLEDNSTSELRIGWPTGQGPEWTAVTSDVFFTGLTIRVDADGAMHMAGYDTEGISETMVRYLRVE